MVHYKTVCEKCDKIMGQCRCPGPKAVHYETCDECKQKVFEELEKNGDSERDNG